MYLNSYEFIFFFLPITVFIYFYLNKKHLTESAKTVLVVGSLIFYGWWNLLYIPLILGSIVFNYLTGSILFNMKEDISAKKKRVVSIGITGNILLLGYFKYADFFIDNINWAAGSHIPLLNLALPLAISFFTFQQIAYLVDVFRGETKRYTLLDYAVFVLFFPKLIAGPIMYHREMFPQLSDIRKKVFHADNISLGIFLFAVGLFKKVVIADSFAMWADKGFDVADVLTCMDAWVTSLSYTFQLYFDFSGYTDMALGAALLFNIKLPFNFDSPYKSLSIRDFWRRWHITLGRFLRDYIYIPLGGNRRGAGRTYINLMVTFLIAGIWHGAGWTFVFWGFLHGLALVIHRIWNRLGFKLNTFLAWMITFNFVNIAWVFFRAKKWEDANKVLKGMFGLTGFFAQTYDGMGYLVIAAGFFICLALANSNSILAYRRIGVRQLIFFAVIFITSYVCMTTKSEFLYFRF